MIDPFIKIICKHTIILTCAFLNLISLYCITVFAFIFLHCIIQLWIAINVPVLTNFYFTFIKRLNIPKTTITC